MKSTNPSPGAATHSLATLTGLVALLLLTQPPALAELKYPIQVTNGLAFRVTGLNVRSPIHIDPVEAQIIAGNWSFPTSHVSKTDPSTPVAAQTWVPVLSDTNGWFSGEWMRGAYVSATVVLDDEEPLILHAMGHNMVYINQELRQGDPYQNGSLHLPFRARKGTNEFLFQVGRGRLYAQILKPKSTVYIESADPTLPDAVLSKRQRAWAGLVIVNTSLHDLRGLEIESRAGNARRCLTPLPTIPALSIRKVPVQIETAPTEAAQPIQLSLELREPKHRAPLHTESLLIRVRSLEQTRKVTFLSAIDGSVQYYAVNPSRSNPPEDRPGALFLSLHGASVEASGQADAYASKRWGTIVAPTNRRPYGFDWEDWGRLDAMEVLSLAINELKPDPRRIYLTGHSMGGHGTWQLGVTFPDRFAAIAPSAGWVSFNSYANGARFTNQSRMADILRRAASSSDTLSLRSNLLHQGVYILHGDADDNVPVTEARGMRDALGQFHRDWILHEQPGAGHWWDVSDEPGADCVDWRPMFDLFSRRIRPRASELRRVQFTTVNPSISSTCYWASIEAQSIIQSPSSIDLVFDPHKNRIKGVSSNVERLRLNLKELGASDGLNVELDGESLGVLTRSRGANEAWFQRISGHWAQAAQPDRGMKNPARGGPFKTAFNHRMVFVYATAGDTDENSWAQRKAKLDAEAFWYRGNGAVDVIPDTEFNPASEPDRSVILYGHAESNRAWEPLLSGCPIRVEKGRVRVGPRAEEGDDLAAVFLRPRRGSDRAHVGVIAGTGKSGMRMLDRFPVFIAGVAYPDWFIADPSTLSRGIDGVRGAGFFGNDWSLERGESVWR